MRISLCDFRWTRYFRFAKLIRNSIETAAFYSCVQNLKMSLKMISFAGETDHIFLSLFDVGCCLYVKGAKQTPPFFLLMIICYIFLIDMMIIIIISFISIIPQIIDFHFLKERFIWQMMDSWWFSLLESTLYTRHIPIICPTLWLMTWFNLAFIYI